MTAGVQRSHLAQHGDISAGPVRLATVSARELALTHLLLRAVRGCTVVPGRDRAGGWRQDGSAPEAAWRVVIGDGRQRIDLLLDDIACRVLLESVPTTVSLDTLDADLRAAVMVCALDPWLAAFESQGGEAVTVRGVERLEVGGTIPSDEAALDCRLDVSLTASGGRRAGIRSSCNVAAAHTIERLLAALPEAPPEALTSNGFHNVAVPVRFELGTSEVTVGELQALEPGDAVLLDSRECLQDRTINVLLGRRHRLRGKLADRRIRIAPSGDAPLNEPQVTEIEERAETGELDAIVLELRFDLGDAEIPVDELRRLKEGRIFDLGGDLDRPVVIRCNDRIVGYGELVEINGERYGVRLLERTP